MENGVLRYATFQVFVFFFSFFSPEKTRFQKIFQNFFNYKNGQFKRKTITNDLDFDFYLDEGIQNKFNN